VAICGQGPLPSKLAPVDRAFPCSLTACRCFVERAVDGSLREVEADHLVVGTECLLDEAVEHSGFDPLVSSHAKGGVGDRPADELLGVHPAAAGHEADEDRLEADPVGDPWPVTAERVLVPADR